MSDPCTALVIDGYPKASRDLFDEVGMTKAYILYERMLRQELPEARVDYFFPSDSEGPPPNTLDNYQMILWTGCNLTVYHQHEATVRNQLALAQKAFDLGIPSFGSCWGLQVAVVAAGGTVKLHPRGREMGVARKIALSPEGQKHPMFKGKNQVFDAFISHDDEVTRLPSNTPVLAGNGYTRVQAAVIRHGKGEFWGVQYHPEYDLFEMARLIQAREEKLMKQGLFKDTSEVIRYTRALESIHKDPDSQKHLAWQYGIDQDLVNPRKRKLEFANFIRFAT